MLCTVTVRAGGARCTCGWYVSGGLPSVIDELAALHVSITHSGFCERREAHVDLS